MSNCNTKHTNDKGDDEMSAVIKSIEQERISYIKGMSQYLEQLKTLSKSEIKKHSEKVLVESDILDKNGNLINHHENASSAKK